MGSGPPTQDWELEVDAGTAASIIPSGQLRRLQRAVDPAMLPTGAGEALARGIGHYDLEDVLLVPATVRPVDSRRHRNYRYAPLCVLGIGERGLGLWAGARAAPGLQAVLSFDDIAAIERDADGPRRTLTVSGAGTGLTVRYDADGDASADLWTRSLRLRCAGKPGPLPDGPRPPVPHGLRPFLAHPDESAVVASSHSLAGHGSSLLAVTEREIIVMQCGHGPAPPWHAHSRVLYVPRGHVTELSVASRILRIGSAGADMTVRLPSRNLAEAASRWLKRLWVGGSAYGEAESALLTLMPSLSSAPAGDGEGTRPGGGGDRPWR